MSSLADATSQALATGVIVAIVIGSLVGLATLVCVSITIYCLCCRKRTLHPGAVIQPQQQQYQGTIIQSQQYAGGMMYQQPYQGIVMYQQQGPVNVVPMPGMQKINLGHYANQ